jgi:hypothetical protein
MSRRRLLAAGQVAVSERRDGTPGTRELDRRCRRGNRSVLRSRCRPPPRLACAPAAGSAGYAGRRAGLTRPQRRTSAATTVTSGGMAEPGVCVIAGSSPNVNTPGGSRASWPAFATSTTQPSTPRLQPEGAPPRCCRPPMPGRLRVAGGWPLPGWTPARPWRWPWVMSRRQLSAVSCGPGPRGRACPRRSRRVRRAGATWRRSSAAGTGARDGGP